MIGWVFFKAEDLSQGWVYVRRLFTISWGDMGMMDFLTFINFGIETKLVLLMAVIFSMPVSKLIKAKLSQISKGRYLIEGVGLLALFIISISYVANDSYNPFIYFRF